MRNSQAGGPALLERQLAGLKSESAGQVKN